MIQSSRPFRHLAVMPAGGAGARLGAAIPKQYLALDGVPMIRHAAAALVAAPWIEWLLIVVAPGDQRAAAALDGLARTTILAEGGETRRDTVLAGLRALRRGIGAGRNGACVRADDDDWVLVHDAARPGLERSALERLRKALAGDPVGGLLAMPIGDTVKRAAQAVVTAGRAAEDAPLGTADPPPGKPAAATAHSALPVVAATVPRNGLWLAQTPQMFRFGLLLEALTRFVEVTDEASAIELAGLAPRLIAGASTNFKVTSAEDLALMRRLIRAKRAGIEER